MGLIKKNSVDKYTSGIRKIDNFTISDIKEGNVLTLYNEGNYFVYIIANYKNLSKYFRNEMSTDSDIVFIRFDARNESKFGYWNFNRFDKRFPKHNKYDDVEITGVYSSTVDIKSIKNSDEFKKVWDEVCRYIGNR